MSKNGLKLIGQKLKVSESFLVIRTIKGTSNMKFWFEKVAMFVPLRYQNAIDAYLLLMQMTTDTLKNEEYLIALNRIARHVHAMMDHLFISPSIVVQCANPPSNSRHTNFLAHFGVNCENKMIKCLIMNHSIGHSSRILDRFWEKCINQQMV